jgi:hypothetical protein
MDYNYLDDLPGIKGGRAKCKFFRLAKEVKPILDSGYAATAADNNGAINVYRDDDGKIRCEAFRFCSLLDEKIFDEYSEAFKWVSKWLKKIK